jgi:hypothetical protein
MQLEPQNDDRDDELSDVLKEWRVEASLPPRFREGVWRRIAISQEKRGAWIGFWRSVAFRWEAIVQKPIGVAACLVFFAAVGVGIGTWHAREFTQSAQTAWQYAYFQSVSPTTAGLSQ